MPLQKQPGSILENATFYFAILFLAAAIGSFFYLQYLAGQTAAELATLTRDAAATKTAEQKNLENRIQTARQQLRDFSAAMAARRAGSEFFTKFEDLVFPEVYFTDCKLDLANVKAVLQGHAAGFEALGRQMAAFQAAEADFTAVNLRKVSMNKDGGIDFDIELAPSQGMVAPK